MRAKILNLPKSDPRFGKEFVVLSVSYSSPTNGLMFQFDDGKPGTQPLMYKASEVSIVGDKLPSVWRMRLRDGGAFDLAPEEWLVDGFWPSYFDYDEPSAVAVYRRVKAAIEAESRGTR